MIFKDMIDLAKDLNMKIELTKSKGHKAKGQGQIYSYPKRRPISLAVIKAAIFNIRQKQSYFKKELIVNLM